MRIKTAINCLILMVLLCLAGCQPQKNAHDYVKHPTFFRATLAECNAMPTHKMQQSETCVFAINLYNQLAVLSHELILDQEAFGRNILRLQIKQAKLKAQIEKINAQTNISRADREKLQALTQQYQALTHQIEVRLVLIADTTGML